MGHQQVRIVGGPFAGFDAELVSADGDRLSVCVMIADRRTVVELRRDQTEYPEDAPAACAADPRDYAVWKAANWSREQHEQRKSAAMAQVERERAAVQERLARDWGFLLPDSLFRFKAFLASLGPVEGRALHDLELSPFGIMDLVHDPARGPRPGIDVRVHGRYYRDPPEFLTFMHGGTDGLHFGLWYDDGRTCTGVVSYYNKDGGGVGLPSGTPLEAVRDRLEWGWQYVEDDDEPADPMDREAAEEGHRLRLLREVLMDFETGDRAEEGEDYHVAYGSSSGLREHGDPDRIETLDGGGALVEGDTAIERGRQRPRDDYDFCTALSKELTEDPVAREAHIIEAKRRCAAGHPADALALGRDLHWISAGNPELEHHANELLTLAYRALGRDGLAAIAQAHHRHRGLPQVFVLEES